MKEQCFLYQSLYWKGDCTGITSHSMHWHWCMDWWSQCTDIDAWDWWSQCTDIDAWIDEVNALTLMHGLMKSVHWHWCMGLMKSMHWHWCMGLMKSMHWHWCMDWWSQCTDIDAWIDEVSALTLMHGIDEVNAMTLMYGIDHSYHCIDTITATIAHSAQVCRGWWIITNSTSQWG